MIVIAADTVPWAHTEGAGARHSPGGAAGVQRRLLPPSTSGQAPPRH